jgi:Serine/threonine protein phosphatase
MFKLFKRKSPAETESKTTPLDSFSTLSGATVPVPKRGGILIGNAQDIGARKDQQDSFGLSDVEKMNTSGLFAVVADGMGGLSNGAVYSKAAVQAALLSFNTEAPEKSDEATMLRILKRAREAVADTGLTDGGTTFIATLIRNQQLHFVSVGDSRISLVRNGGLIQLNREHVYGRELDDLALNGILSEEEATRDRQRAAITSYLGKQDEINVDRNINAIPLFSGDKVLLMSDGVYGYLPEAELVELLRQKPMPAAEAIRNALLAKKNPHQDNLTIIIMEIE